MQRNFLKDYTSLHSQNDASECTKICYVVVTLHFSYHFFIVRKGNNDKMIEINLHVVKTLLTFFSFKNKDKPVALKKS